MTVFGATKSYEDEIHAVWVNPTQFDVYQHGPPYLPPGNPSVKLATDQKAQVQGWVKKAQEGSLVAEYLDRMAKDYAVGPLGHMAALLVCLRAAAMIHQTHHW